MRGRCLWCGDVFAARQSGGKPQRFCCPCCRRAFHHALHAWAHREWAEGRVTTVALRGILDERARCPEAV